MDAPVSLDVLITSSNHVSGRDIADFASLAAGVQHERRVNGASDRDEITRSTALATLAAVDPDIADALRQAGLDVSAFESSLGIRTISQAAAIPDARLDPIFADAVRRYLASESRRRVDLPDLAVAILSSSQQGPDGQLPDRLQKLGLDYERAIAALLQVLPLSRGEAELFPEPTGLSAVGVPSSDHAFASDTETGPETETATEAESETFDRTTWTTDTPASGDMLGRRFLATALATRLRGLADSHSTSFLIHIDGPWGSGKSSLFALLESELRPAFLVVKVNAWREQQVGVQWWTLHNALRKVLEGDSRHRIWARARSRFDAIRTRIVPLVAVLVLVVIAVTIALLARLDLTTGSALADALGKILTLATLGVAGLTAAYRLVMPESRMSAEAFVSKSANPMGQVQELFARTLRRTRKPVVFLIDDLDRCEAQHIIDFLEVMQTLVREHPEQPARRTRWWRAARTATPQPVGPYAFIAADGQWIRSSFESHFASVKLTEVPGRPLGYLFLEKIFQLQVRLPSITDDYKRAYLDWLLTGAAPDRPPSAAERDLETQITADVNAATTGREIARAAARAQGLSSPGARMEVRGAAAVRYSDPALETRTQHELSKYWRLLDPNPRSIKLVVHNYLMLQTLRTLDGIPLQPTPLALWTIVEIRWPQLADHLRAHPDDIEPRHAGGRAKRAGAPARLAALLASPEVQAVVASPTWGALTPTQVRACTGFRVGASADTD